MNLATLTRASLLSVALLVGACGGDKPEALLASAKSYLAKSDPKSAIIQIKSALQAEPDLAEARFLLGVALLDSANPGLAELELRKALALNFDRNRVIPKLAAALLAQGEVKKLVGEFAQSALDIPRASAELNTSLSAAHEALGDAASADAALAAALEADPRFVPALIVQARRKAAGGDVDAAALATEAIIATAPDSYEAWALKADLLWFAKKPNDALVAYRKALELRRDFFPAVLKVATIELQLGDTAAAEVEINELKRLAPNHVETRYQQALLAVAKKDLAGARAAAQELLKVAPDNASALQLAGILELELNSLIQAEVLLKKALQRAPGMMLARRSLIQVYLRTGRASLALDTLNSVPGKGGVPAELYSVAGEVHLRNGNSKLAEEYFAKSVAIDPKNNRRRTSLAIASLLNGQTRSAFSQLQDISASDKGIDADLAMINAHMRRREFDQALAAITALEKKQPDKPLAAQLRGRTYLAQRNSQAARSSFESALKIDAAYYPAIASLAALDVSEKKPDAARKRFEDLLAKDPKNMRAMLGAAELAAVSGSKPAEVAALLDKAVAANPREPAPRLLLIEHHLRTGDFKQATRAAVDASAALPDNALMVDALGRTQLAAGDFNQALSTFNRLASLQPHSPHPHARLAEVHMAANQKEAAAQSLRRSLEIKPDLLQSQQRLASLEVSNQRYGQALAIARTVQTQRPSEAAGYVLEGDIRLGEKNWDAASSAYRTGLKQAPSSELAFKLVVSLTSAGKSGEADQWATSWLKEHSTDVAFLNRLGDFALTRKDFPAAEKHYQAMLKISPEQPGALNNLAWVAGALNRPNAASYAEKANALAPNQPAFMDTWAMLLSQHGEAGKAVELQTRALELEPGNAMMRLNLAKIYMKAGDKQRAKEQLVQIVQLGDRFAGQAEVTDLMKGL